MTKLRLHYIIVFICSFSFLLMVGRVIVSQEKTAFNTSEKPGAKAKNNRIYKLMKVEKLKKTGSGKNDVQVVKMVE